MYSVHFILILQVLYGNDTDGRGIIIIIGTWFHKGRGGSVLSFCKEDICK